MEDDSPTAHEQPQLGWPEGNTALCSFHLLQATSAFSSTNQSMRRAWLCGEGRNWGEGETAIDLQMVLTSCAGSSCSGILQPDAIKVIIILLLSPNTGGGQRVRKEKYGFQMVADICLESIFEAYVDY